MTNRDVINKMTNAELGRFLNHVDCANCAYYNDDDEAPNVCMMNVDCCAEGFTKWLKLEPDFRMIEYIKTNN